MAAHPQMTFRECCDSSALEIVLQDRPLPVSFLNTQTHRASVLIRQTALRVSSTFFSACPFFSVADMQEDTAGIFELTAQNGRSCLGCTASGTKCDSFFLKMISELFGNKNSKTVFFLQVVSELFGNKQSNRAWLRSGFGLLRVVEDELFSNASVRWNNSSHFYRRAPLCAMFRC